MDMRIVSLSPSSTEILYAIGAGNDLVAVTNTCDYPMDALRHKRIGSWLHTDPEHIIKCKPDLIVTTNYLPTEILNHPDLVRCLLHLEPSGLSSVFSSILELGNATGRNEASEEAVKKMQNNLEELRNNQPKNRLKIYSEDWPDPPMQAGNWVPEIIDIVGGIPVGGLHAQQSKPTDIDALKAADPDLMIFQWCDSSFKGNTDVIRSRKGWDELRAVKYGSVAFIPHSILNRPGPRLVEGAKALQRALQAFQHMF